METKVKQCPVQAVIYNDKVLLGVSNFGFSISLPRDTVDTLKYDPNIKVSLENKLKAYAKITFDKKLSVYDRLGNTILNKPVGIYFILGDLDKNNNFIKTKEVQINSAKLIGIKNNTLHFLCKEINCITHDKLKQKWYVRFINYLRRNRKNASC